MIGLTDDRLRESAIWFESAGESLRRKPEGVT